ncbi:MAG: FxDxF family PEP-CTERM protein [Nitrosomonas sp.]|uniref:FxDxF family PEP-CTERM protein n=1 Tax=Nitrosomonas sp. TaxID=42353 RepID=UPI00273631BA|nr:FxDxF family PEP-CTERM protein [Nitrosomonas sp.]MDP3663993.1 FxDxF family PEP-CTERM protein [Nitrosomonas sp.]MDZ4106114.1 FxDxF family PEP-CTERM protein [Nitrosomonas sp.]
MRFKLLAVASAFAFASTNSLANDVDNDITAVGGTNFFGVVHTDSFDFTDTFTFNVTPSSSPWLADASLVTTNLGSSVHNIDFTSASLNGVPLTLSPTGDFEFGNLSTTNFLNGPLILTVTGHSGAEGGQFASYSGTMNISLVPEPETYAMLLAGLGLLGFMARRRNESTV